MSVFILCLECKEILGRYTAFIECYALAVKMLNKEICNINPNKLTLSANKIEGLEEILDLLGLEKDCCRTHMLTGASFDKFLQNITEK
jgi:DNA-directed RNA polymerase subunit N (RpoN/RPB10)